jgi:Peptidase inhibitor I9
VGAGEITKEFKLVNAYAATFPEDHVVTLGAHPAVDQVEEDKIVTTQASDGAGDIVEA